MNIRNNAALREKLAAEFVLGTLKGGARRRFEGWLHSDAALRRTTAEWQDRLVPMAEFATSQTPRRTVWHAIERRLNLRRPAHAWEFWRNESVTFWRWFCAASSAVAAMLVVVLALRTNDAPVISYVAALTDDQARTALLVTADSRHQLLGVRMVNSAPVASGKSLELWVVPKQGTPRSLGVLAQGKNGQNINLALPASAIGNDVAMLAVSLEPAGGAPEPKNGPTGPVLYHGAWVQML